jgi:multiple sugar transport system permease protein
MDTTRKRPLHFQILLYLVLSIYLLVVFGPLYWMGLTSLRTSKQIYDRIGMLIPRDLTLQNYVYALTEKPLLTWLGNSFLIAGVTVILSLIIAAMAGYAIARLRFPGRAHLARILVYTYLVPSSLLFIPMFVIIGRAGLRDSQPGLILAYLSFTVPFATWILFGFFLTIPRELEDAALTDGCSYFGVLFRIVLPLAKPGIAATFIFAFTDAWNEFLYAAVLLDSPAKLTAPLGLLQFRMADNLDWGPLMAAAILTTIPAVIFFIMAQKYIVSGLTAGSVKG